MQRDCRNNPCPVGRPHARYFCCGRCAGMHKCRERRMRKSDKSHQNHFAPRLTYRDVLIPRVDDPQERPSAVLSQCPACGAPLSLLSLASPGLALRGEPVQRDNPCATQSPLRCGTGPSRPWLGRSAGEGPPDLHVNYRLTYWTFVLSASPLPGPLRGSAM